MDIIGRLTDIKDAQTKAGAWQTRLYIQEGNRKIVASTQAGSDAAGFAKTLIKGNSYKFSLGGDGSLIGGSAWYFFNHAEPVNAVDPPAAEPVGHSITDTGEGSVDVDNPWPAKDRGQDMQSAYKTSAEFFKHRLTFLDAEGKEWPYTTDHLHTLAAEIYAKIEMARAGEA